MRLFQKPSAVVDARNGFRLGDVVRHKVSGKPAVIIGFSEGFDVTVSVGFEQGDEFTCNVWEVELRPAATGDSVVGIDATSEEGNQQRGGLRGDPGAPRTVTAPTRE